MEALSGKSVLWSAAWNRVMMLLTQAVVCYHGPRGLPPSSIAVQEPAIGMEKCHLRQPCGSQTVPCYV